MLVPLICLTNRYCKGLIKNAVGGPTGTSSVHETGPLDCVKLVVSRGSHSLKEDNLFQECDFPSLVCVCVFVTVTKCEGFFDFFTSILFFLQKQKTQGHVSGAHFVKR